MIVDRIKENKKMRIVLLLAIALSLIGSLVSIGKFIALPLTFSVTADSISESVQGRNCGAIVDRARERVIIVNGKGRVTDVKGSVMPSSSTINFGALAVYGDSVYIQKIVYNNDSGVIVSDKVLRYSADSKKQKAVFEFDYDTKTDPHTESSLVGIFITNGKGLAVFTGHETDSVYTASFPLNTDDGAVEIDRSSLELLGALPDGEDVYDSAFDPTTGNIYILGTMGNVFCFDSSDGVFERTEATGKVGRDCLLEVSGDGTPEIIQQNDKEGADIQFSFGLAARLLWFWASLAFLAVLLVIICVCAVIRTVKSRRYRQLKILTASLCVLIAACSIVGLYTVQLNNRAIQDQEVMLKSLSILASQSDSDEYASAVNEYREKGKITADTYKSIASSMQSNSDDLIVNGCNIQFTLIAVENGRGYALADSTRTMIAGMEYTDASQVISGIEGKTSEKKSSNSQVITGTYKNIWGSFSYAIHPMYDDNGNLSGFLVASSDIAIFSGSLMAKQFAILAGLLSMAIAATFLISEISAFAKAWRLRREMIQKNEKHPEVAFARTLFFLGAIGDSIATSMAVLIVRDMLHNTDMSGTTLLMSLPLVANTLGCLVGGFLFAVLSKRFSDRSLILITQIPACFFFILMTVSVIRNDYFLFIIFTFIASFFLQSCINLGMTIPLRLSDEKYRGRANAAMATTAISVASLGTLAAGYIATLFGNEFVFAVAAAFPLLVIVLVLLIIPKQKLPKQLVVKAHERTHLKDILAFIMNPQLIILLVFVVGTLSISTGYKSYLFPLILADNGFTKNDFASAFVVCNAIAFFVSPIFTRIGSRIGYRKLAAIFIVVMSLVFFGFTLNSMLFWSFMVLVVAVLCDKVISPCWKTLWPRAIKGTGVTNEQGYAIVDSVCKVFNTARAPIWGALAIVGQTFACLAFAVYAAVAAAVFMLTTRKGPFADKKPPSDF